MADYNTFIAVFPEFATMAAASPTAVNYWLSQAPLRLAVGRLGANFDLASMLFVAHNIVLSAKETAIATKGAIPGGTLGPISSKSVGGASVSYDVGMAAIAGAGEWNATSYGQRLYTLIKAASMGGIYRAPCRRFR